MSGQNTEALSINNFNIQDTMEMGMGNSQLLNDIMSPETSTANPEEIQEIVKNVEPPVPSEEALPKGKEIVKPEGEQNNPADAIMNFLGDSDNTEIEEKPKKNISDVSKGISEDVEQEQQQEQQEGTQFSALANDLFNLGVLTKDEEEEDVVINTPEEFLARFNTEKQKGAIEMVNNFIGQFGDEYQKAFDAIFVKGANPKEYFNTLSSIENFSQLDLTQESNQEIVVKQTLLEQGFDNEDVEAEIEKLKNYGDLEDTAKRHHKVLVKKEATKLQQLEQKAQLELQQKAMMREQYQNNVQAVLQEKLKTKEFDGIPLNPKLAGELQDFLLVDKWKTASGENLTDFDKTILELKRPENHEMKVKVALLLKILEKDPMLTTIQKTGVTKQSNQLFGALAKQVVNTKKSNSTQPTSWFK